MLYDMSGTLVCLYRLESRTYRIALLITSRGPSALAELLVKIMLPYSLAERNSGTVWGFLAPCLATTMATI